MPIYEFKCDRCDRKFEKLCRMGEGNGAACPNCGGTGRRLFSAFFAGRSSSGESGSSGSSCAGCTSSNCATCK